MYELPGLLVGMPLKGRVVSVTAHYAFVDCGVVLRPPPPPETEEEGEGRKESKQRKGTRGRRINGKLYRLDLQERFALNPKQRTARTEAVLAPGMDMQVREHKAGMCVVGHVQVGGWAEDTATRCRSPFNRHFVSHPRYLAGVRQGRASGLGRVHPDGRPGDDGGKGPSFKSGAGGVKGGDEGEAERGQAPDRGEPQGGHHQGTGGHGCVFGEKKGGWMCVCGEAEAARRLSPPSHRPPLSHTHVCRSCPGAARSASAPSARASCPSTPSRTCMGRRSGA